MNMEKMAAYFWKHVRKTKTCWLWIGPTAGVGPYGYMHVSPSVNKVIRAHRFSWLLHNGEIPQKMGVLHYCDTPLCIRPDHLFVGTQKQNHDDMVEKGRNSAPPHPCGEKHHNTFLTREQVLEIREERKKGVLISALSKRFRCSRATVSAIATRRVWAHI